MKRKYIKPVTTVLMVETQNNYCLSGSCKWVVSTKYEDNGHVEVENSKYDMGRVIMDKDDAVHEYDPWNSKNW